MKRRVRLGLWTLAWVATWAPARAAEPSLDAERTTGSYQLLDPGTNGEMQLLWLGKGKLRVSFDLYYRGGGVSSGATGVGVGEATLRGNTASYRSTDFPQCKLSLTFEPGNVVTVSGGGEFECGFGHHVIADGSYRKLSGRKPSFDFADGGKKPLPTDIDSLSQQASEARAHALGLAAGANARREQLKALLAKRKELNAAIAATKAESDKRLKAGQALQSKAFSAKPDATPAPAELWGRARTELQAARAAAKEAVSATAQLRATEDELVQLIASAAQGASDAKRALKETRDLSGKLIGQAAAEGEDAKKAALAASQSQGKSRAALGIQSDDQFQKQRDKSSKEEEAFQAALATARAERAKAETAGKAAAKPSPEASSGKKASR
jgi:hypothetical protein